MLPRELIALKSRAGGNEAYDAHQRALAAAESPDPLPGVRSRHLLDAVPSELVWLFAGLARVEEIAGLSDEERTAAIARTEAEALAWLEGSQPLEPTRPGASRDC